MSVVERGWGGRGRGGGARGVGGDFDMCKALITVAQMSHHHGWGCRETERRWDPGRGVRGVVS